MLTTLLQWRLDAAAFALLLGASLAGVHLWLRHKRRGAVEPRTWVLLLVVIAFGVFLAEHAGRTERGRLQAMLEGIAPTYAQELQRMGHARVTERTPADDPLYLSMIEAQVRWLKANPNAADVYTFRKRDDGTVVLVVDSETDYDRDGVFDEEADDGREARTEIGEPYDEVTPAMEAAFGGVAGFDSDPEADRWGTWVTAYAPMYDDAGRVEAVLGVDYDAARWLAAVALSRGAALGSVAVLAVILITSTALITVTRVELAKRTAAEHALRQSEGRLRTILDAEPEAVMVTDPSGHITELNPAGLSMLEAASSADVLGSTFAERVGDVHRVDYTRLHGACVAGDASGASLEFPVTGLRGAVRWVDARAVPLRDNTGAVTAVLSVLRDVTARREAQEERERLQRELLLTSRQAGMAEVATGVLHNVGNVLNSVNVSATVLTDKLNAGRADALRKATDLMREHRADLGTFLTADAKGRVLPDYLAKLSDLMSAERDEMVKELGGLARSVDHIREIIAAQQRHAKAVNAREAFALADVADEAVRMIGGSLERHGVQLERGYAADCPPVYADRHKVLQILVNLITNAKKAIGSAGASGSRITIAIEAAKGSVEGDARRMARVSVIDTGVGIKHDDLSKLFNHGFTTRTDGHGFGLHTAAIAAQQMGGGLTAASDGPGRGATFTLELPLQTEHAPCRGN